MVEGSQEVTTYHPVTGKPLKVKITKAEGRISDWQYFDTSSSRNEKSYEIEALMRAGVSFQNPMTNWATYLQEYEELWTKMGLTQEQMLQKAKEEAEKLSAELFEEAASGRLVDPDLILSQILGSRENRDIPDEEAEQLVKDSGIMGIYSDPSVTMRMMWDKEEKFRQMFLMHSPSLEQQSRYKLALDTNLSAASKTLLEEAHQRLKKLRSGNYKYRDANAGGLVICENKAAAISAAYLLKGITGVKPRVITSDSEEANDQISEFRDSDEEWVVTVKMISEGVDIKRLRVIAYLSNVMSELFLAQVMGRITRWRDDISQEEQTAYFYAMAYPPLLDKLRLIDGKVLTQASAPLPKPTIPALPVECTPLTKKQGMQDIKGCDHINEPTHSACWHCGAPLKTLRRKTVDITASEIERSGTMWKGKYAEEAYVKMGEWLVDNDEFLEGVSEQVVAVITKFVQSKEARNIWGNRKE
jgi:hypothetical protein